jgi:hypothetical protein
MILCRCLCGQAYPVSDDEAGATVECPECGQTFVVPAASDPDLLLVLPAGAADPEQDALPLTRAEVRDRLAADAAAAADQVFCDGRWEPLAAWAARDAAADSTGQPEPAAPAPRPALRRKAAAVELAAVAEPAAAASSEAAAPGKPAARGPWKRYGRPLFALLVLFFGYKYGFGPILFHALKRPALVIVKNGDAIGYEATLGWRRLSQELPAASACRFEVYVGMPERQTLALTPQEGGGSPERIRLHVRPGAAVLVNVGRKTLFTALDEAAVRPRRVEGELAALARQVAAHEAPLGAVELVRAVQDIGRAAVRTRLDEPVIDLAAYRLDEYLGFGTRPGQDENLPKLTALPSYRVAFANGHAQIQFDQPDRHLEASLELPALQVALPPDVSLAIPDRHPVLVTRVADRIQVVIRLPRHALNVRKGSFPGNWDYSATGKPGEPDGWKWSWTFRGEGNLEGQNVRIESVWNRNELPVVKTDPVKR